MIYVTNIVKRFGDHCVLDGASLEVRRGEVAAVIGPSGGGKSTLLRCINGLESFDGGEIRVHDIALRAGGEPRRLSRRESGQTLLALRRCVGMVFQQFNLFPHLSVLDNVLIGPRLALKQSREEAVPFARHLLDRVGLGDKLCARPEQLSGGQQQRVAIARALAVKPETILFDEPTSALDPRMAGEVLAVIADLAKQGQTMIVVTHAMGFARNVATTVHVMHAGRVAESGPSAQVFDDPRSEATRHFFSEAGSNR
jgi:ABC-type polar amino acid transport system ATPase subunit